MPMVSTSNWPPWVAMSVVRRWRRTFSSSTTQLRSISGFCCSKFWERRCMRIMSALLTVAMVRVCAALAAPAKAIQVEPSNNLLRFISVSSSKPLGMWKRLLFLLLLAYCGTSVSASLQRCGGACTKPLLHIDRYFLALVHKCRQHPYCLSRMRQRARRDGDDEQDDEGCEARPGALAKVLRISRQGSVRSGVARPGDGNAKGSCP